MTDSTEQAEPAQSPAGPIMLATLLLIHVTGLIVTGVLLWAVTLEELWQTFYIVFGMALWLFTGGMVLTFFLGLAEVAAILRRRVNRQPELDVAFRLRVLLYVLVAWVFLNVFVFSFRISLMAYVTLSLGYGAYTYWTLRRAKSPGKTSPRMRRIVDTVGINVALTLVIAEISLRVVALVWPAPILVTEKNSVQELFAAYRPPAGSSYWGSTVNENGFYDTEFQPPSVDRGRVVAAIGDSFSTWVVPHPFHFTTVAEQELAETEIYNIGFSAIGPLGYLFLLENQALPLQPDAIVINLFVGNDLIEGAPQAESRWYDTDNFLVAVVWERLKTLLISKLAAPETGKSSARTREELLEEYPVLSDPLLEKPTFDRELFLTIEAERALAVSLPNEETYERFFEALEALANAAGDTPIAFMLIPDEFQVDEGLWEEVVTRTGAELDRDYPQRRIVEWLQSRGYPHLDLLPILRSTPPLDNGKHHLYKLQDTHFNARGNAVTGKALAGFLQDWLAEIEEQGGSTRAATLAAMPIPQSIDTVQAYAALLADLGFDGSFVLDNSRLTLPRNHVLAAVTSLTSVGDDAAEKAGFVELARTLAFFQPGVGEATIALDAAGPEGKTWRSIVQADMRTIEAALSGAQADTPGGAGTGL